MILPVAYCRLLAAMAAVLLSCAVVCAQPYISLGGISPADFPRITSAFYAVDAAGKPMTALSPSDVVVRENGVVRPVASIRCPSGDQLTPLSAVLAVDVSRSMDGGNLGIAQAAARAWIQAMSFTQAECAITSFDHAAYLNQDFTSSRALLSRAIDGLAALGGTDYDTGFISTPVGCIPVAQRGRYKRVVVFLTDGIGGGNAQRIISLAAQNNVSVYCICIKMKAPTVLRSVAEQTGGQWFEFVNTTVEAENIYRRILAIEQRNKPCEIEWQSESDCSPVRNVQIELKQYGVFDNNSYTMPDTSFRSLVVAPPSLRFGGVEPRKFLEKDVVLTAGRMAIRIDDIRCSHRAFSVVRGGAPPGFVLAPGESHTVRIRFAPLDSVCVFATLDIIGNQCTTEKVYLTGGFPSVPGPAPMLKLVVPNGGEQLGVGADTAITWEGTAPGDTLTLDYSIDNGQTWLPITEAATGLRHAWAIPNTPSDKCLARLRQFPAKERPVVELRLYQAPVTSVAFAADGSFVLGSCSEAAALWPSDKSGLPNQTYGFTGGFPRIVRSSAISPDGAFVAIAGENMGGGRIFDVASGQKVLDLQGHIQPVNYIEYSPDGSVIATASEDNTAILWDATTGAEMHRLSGHSQPVHSARFNADGTRIITTSDDNTARLWDVATGQSIAILIGHTDHVRAADFSPDGTIVATAGLDGSIRFWDVKNYVPLYMFVPPAPVYDIDFSPVGPFLVAAYGDGTVGIWNYETRESVRLLEMNYGTVLCARFGPDGNTVAAGSLGAVAFVWNVQLTPVQEAISKAAWSIVIPAIVPAQIVDMGTAFVGTSRDSLVSQVLCNLSDVPLRVDNITFEGNNSGDFSLVSGAPPFVILPRGCATMEFRFTPSAVGSRSADVRISTQYGDIIIPFIGTGVDRSFAIRDRIDFGAVPTGDIRDTAATIVIANPMAASVQITAVHQEGPDTEQFTLLEPKLPFSIKPGGLDSLKVRFSPVRTGRTSGKIVFDHTINNQPFETMLYGEGICGASAPGPNDSIRISALDAAGASGKIATVNVRIAVPAGKYITTPAPFKIALRVNNTVLFPVGTTPKGDIDGGDRLITISGVYDGNSDTLVQLQFIPALGNSATAELAIESFSWQECAVPTAVQSGQFVVTDVCRAGGTRLFSPDGSLGMSSFPNPATEQAIVEFDLRETGTTTLDIVDIYGRSVLRLVDEVKTKGSYSLPIDIAALPAGSYVLLLQTRTAALGAMIQVVR